jgi:hypothetical protein
MYEMLFSWVSRNCRDIIVMVVFFREVTSTFLRNGEPEIPRQPLRA